VVVEGIDADADSSAYLDDTDPSNQELAHPGQHDFGLTVSRLDLSEGTESTAGGNGITGHDETSENYSRSWWANTDHTIGALGNVVALEEETWARIKMRYRAARP
jgi:hypothetical protein